MVDQESFYRSYISSNEYDQALGYAVERINDEKQYEYYDHDAPLDARLGAILGRAIAYSLSGILSLDKERHLAISLTIDGFYVDLSRDEYERRALAVLWQALCP
jgi:hypothetical protein